MTFSVSNQYYFACPISSPGEAVQRDVEGDEHYCGGDEGSQQSRSWFTQVRDRCYGILLCC